MRQESLVSRKSPASLLFVAATALSVSVGMSLVDATPSYAQAAGEVPISAEAKARFSAGVQLLKDPDGARYDEALREFQAAYAASPSWKILGNLGLCAMKLERNGDALEAYTKYLAQGGTNIDAAEKKQIETDVALMKRGSSTVTVVLKGASGQGQLQDSRVKADGRMALNLYPLPANKPVILTMQSGHHVVVAKISGQELKWEVDLVGGSPAEHTFQIEAKPATPPPAATASAAPSSTATEAPPPPPPAEPSGFRLRTAGYITGSVGVAALVGGVIAGAVGKSKLSSLESDCPNNVCPAGKKSDADSIESLQTTANVLLIGGVVLAGAGVTMVVLDRPKAAPAAALFAPTLRVGPAPTTGGGGLLASGTF